MSRGKSISTAVSTEWEIIYNKYVGHYLEFILRGICGAYDSDKPTDPFEVVEGWKWETIGNISELTKNLDIHRNLDAETIINYVDIDAVDNQLHIIREAKVQPVSALSSRARRVLQKGQILYSLVRPYLNNVAIIEEDKENYIGSTGFVVFGVQGNSVEFVKNWLLTPFVALRFQKLISGFNSPSITANQFLNLPIPIPPSNVQEEVVKVLNGLRGELRILESFCIPRKVLEGISVLQSRQRAFLELMHLQNHQLNLLKQARQSFLREAMQGRLVPQDPQEESAEHLLKRIKAEKARLIREGKLKKEKPLPPIKAEELPFDLPEGWVWCRLGEVVVNHDHARIPIPKAERMRRQGDFDYYGASGVIDKIDGYTHSGEFVLIGEDGANLVNRNTPISFIVCGDFWVNNHVHVLQVLDCITKEYLNSYLNSCNLKPFLSGGFQPKLTKMDLSSIPLPLPPLAEQARIVAKLEEVLGLCDALTSQVQKSQAQVERLLAQVLREALEG